ncbi:hypothetical protein [Pseudobutyrivibrio xylanivorans]|uniref:Uncharacterized protein n=1 Tax=Pseudobutyrivibrio xylanivorans TaxID=185007 RepID=A0A5P6VVP0_PSEXY|nr:hypothetical protein [Pseudobutyrivibrio xylanivorans]QFJ55271.1 hypothetical protein FXF36_10555 [Pseudobutyrivibrio xylanivorans]
MSSYGSEVVITKHAYSRLKERNGWNKKASDRMIPKVYVNGLRPEQIKGYLKNWVITKYEYSNERDEYVLFGDKLYIFNNKTMLTVLPTPARSYLYPAA